MEPRTPPSMLGNTRDIIKALNGPSVIADELKCLKSAVSNWHRLGIPTRHWMALQALAARLGVTLTQEQLHAASEAARAAPRQAGSRGRPREVDEFATAWEAEHAQEAP